MKIWLIRQAHWAVGIGGILYGAIEVMIALAVNTSAPLSQQVSSPVQQGGESLQIFALILLTLGLVGLYLRGRYDHPLRTLGFLMAFAGTQLAVGLLWSGAFLLPYLSQTVPDIVDSFITSATPQLQFGLMLGNFMFGIGWMVFAIAQIVVDERPRIAWLLIAIAMPMFMFSPILGGLLFVLGLGWIMLAYQRGQGLQPDFAPTV